MAMESLPWDRLGAESAFDSRRRGHRRDGWCRGDGENCGRSENKSPLFFMFTNDQRSCARRGFPFSVLPASPAGRGEKMELTISA
jgi:hypothetical protein